MSVGDRILAKNLMILASAGSGKTFQLGNRVIGLIGARGVEPERIVALTFTRKAAGEFADSMLMKLARGALDAGEARKLCEDLGETVEAGLVLEKVVRALPRLQLGTMDGFFARVVRGFQYELGLSGGTFDLIEGPRLKGAMAEILGGMLGDVLEAEEGVEFLHAFRRATLGREGQGVLKAVEKFMESWHGLWKSGVPLAGWGGVELFDGLPEIEEWEREKGVLIGALRGTGGDKAVGVLLDLFESHTVGSGKLGKAGVLFERLLEEVPGSGEIEVKMGRGMLKFDTVASGKWRALYRLLAGCELAAAVARTAAVGGLVSRLDLECERRLRSRGLLGFDDVKALMGAWTRSEEARLRREAVDFRLDARYDHWLLDEFQDTSVAEWEGLEPLLDEAVSGEEGSLFVVGDRKQAIYGWRGGEVALFDRVENRYKGGLETCTMPESWRSCPVVLELVNRVCGDFGTIGELFGEEMVSRWPWENHLSAKPGVSGVSRVEEVAKEEQGTRLVELLREVGAGEREMSCGVLVRTNEQVREVAGLLREAGFDVIEEGRRLPVADNAVGVALLHLVRWLADPADDFAREVLGMSPLQAVLAGRHGEAWQARWEGALEEARVRGYAGMVEALIEPLWDGLSVFARRRAGDVIGALAEFDARGGATPRAARDWIAELEISQAPGAAAVQVMTIHKAKGLGFDMVVLPAVEDRTVPDRGKFEVARGGKGGEAWVLQTPAKWVRDLTPELLAAEERWADDQRYEAMCVLYVALTRAKRGLYVFLPPVPKSRKDGEEKSSHATWVRQAVCGEDGVFEAGDAEWFRSVAARKGKAVEVALELVAGVKKRPRTTPSGAKGGAVAGGRRGGGLRVGLEVHGLLQAIGWLRSGEVPAQAPGQAGKIVEEALREEDFHRVFEKPEGAVTLFREQPFEVLLDGRWMSGVIDRMHVVRNAGGDVERVEVYDFKTDAVETLEALTAVYGAQMAAYRAAMRAVFGECEVRCLLVSTALRRVGSAEGA